MATVDIATYINVLQSIKLSCGSVVEERVELIYSDELWLVKLELFSIIVIYIFIINFLYFYFNKVKQLSTKIKINIKYYTYVI